MSTYATERAARGEHPAPTSWLADAIGLSRKCLNTTTATERSTPCPGDDALVEKITDVLAEFACYGYRRVTPALKRHGETVNKKRVARVMRERGLAQKRRKSPPRTTDSRHRLRTFPNLVKDLAPDHPFHVVALDITYVRLERGFSYVALVFDTFTRRVVGWAVDTHMETSLVVEALTRALTLGTP